MTTGYTLTWKTRDTSDTSPSLADGGMLRPDILGVQSIEQVRATTVARGNEHASLGDFFDVSGEAGPRLVVRGAPPLPRMGARMAEGELIVEGDAGDELGAAMRGGVIRVAGRAGHRAGGPDYTSEHGMNGGEIVIAGEAGDYVGLRMRRGLIVVGGRAGRSPGYRMLAGTVVVMRGELNEPGLEMRRGTVVGLDVSTGRQRHAWMREEGTFPTSSITAAGLLLRRMNELGIAPDPAVLGGALRLSSGDHFELGKGELWQRLS